MNRKVLVLLTVLAVVFMACNHQVFAQDKNYKSNGTLEIIAVHVPDSVVFKPAEGVEMQSWKTEVSLVSGTRSFRAIYFASEGLTMMAPDGRAIYFDKTEKICAFPFNVPSDFEAKTIKFVVNGKEMYFDLVNSEWE